MKILIVDDSATMRRIIVKGLTEAGYREIVEAENGIDAISKMAGVGLILTNWHMPVMDGLGLVKEVRKNPNLADVRIIMVSPAGSQKDILEALQAGVNNVIVKPFSPDFLIERLKSMIGHLENPSTRDAVIEVKYINPFVNSLYKTCAHELGMTPVRSAAILKEYTKAKGDISAIVAFTGEAVRGTVALTFPRATALTILHAFVGEQAAPSDAEVQKVVSQLVNSVTLGARSEFEECGFPFQTSLPIIIEGNAHTVIHECHTPIVLIPFKLEGHPFALEISMKFQFDDKSLMDLEQPFESATS